MKNSLIALSVIIVLLSCNRSDISSCCTSTPQIVNSDTSVIALPDIFTPNADGINDILYVLRKNILSNGFSFTVLNKREKTVFSTTDLSIGWDGTEKGKPVKEKEYFISIQATTTSGAPINLTGTVCIIRDNCAKNAIQNCFFSTQFNGTAFDTNLPSYENIKPCK